MSQPPSAPQHLRPEDILKELLSVIRKHRREASGDTWAPLGAPIFKRFQRLGTRAGYKAWHAHIGGRPAGSYLWDLTWTYEPEGAKRYWLELAGEVELSDTNLESIKDDFYKVLDAKARLKFFVWGVQSTPLRKDLEKEIDWAVLHQRFRLPQERLVVIMVEWDAKGERVLCRIRLFDGRGPMGRWKRAWEEKAFKW